MIVITRNGPRGVTDDTTLQGDDFGALGVPYNHLVLLGPEANELVLFDQIYEALARQVVTPDLVVYLTASVDMLMARIYRRDRSFERRPSRRPRSDALALSSRRSPSTILRTSESARCTVRSWTCSNPVGCSRTSTTWRRLHVACTSRSSRRSASRSRRKIRLAA